MKPPMPYAGGKQNLAEKIVDLFPEHAHYVEPYGGALSVLLAKPRSMLETINDLNGDLMTFWRVLREQPDDLERVCAFTPHSRAEYMAAREIDGSIDDLERARRVWVHLTQSRGATLNGKSGWRFVHGTNRMALARYLGGYLARIAPAAERLREVSLESRDALDVITAYGRPDALLYVDPPYVLSTRHGEQYAHEMSDGQHEELLTALAKTPAAVVLSGYESDLYDDILTGWAKVRFAANAMTGGPRTEVAWLNFEQPGVLFGGVA